MKLDRLRSTLKRGNSLFDYLHRHGWKKVESDDTCAMMVFVSAYSGKLTGCKNTLQWKHEGQGFYYCTKHAVFRTQTWTGWPMNKPFPGGGPV